MERHGIQVCPVTLQDVRDYIDFLISSDSAGVKRGRGRLPCPFGLLRLIGEPIVIWRACRWPLRICAACMGAIPWRSTAGARCRSCWAPLPCNQRHFDRAGNPRGLRNRYPRRHHLDPASVRGAVHQVYLFCGPDHPPSGNDNAELLWHCGNFPPSLAADPGSAKLSPCVRIWAPCPAKAIGNPPWRHDRLPL